MKQSPRRSDCESFEGETKMCVEVISLLRGAVAENAMGVADQATHGTLDNAGC